MSKKAAGCKSLFILKSAQIVFAHFFLKSAPKI